MQASVLRTDGLVEGSPLGLAYDITASRETLRLQCTWLLLSASARADPSGRSGQPYIQLNQPSNPTPVAAQVQASSIAGRDTSNSDSNFRIFKGPSRYGLTLLQLRDPGAGTILDPGSA